MSGSIVARNPRKRYGAMIVELEQMRDDIIAMDDLELRRSFRRIRHDELHPPAALLYRTLYAAEIERRREKIGRTA